MTDRSSTPGRSVQIIRLDDPSRRLEELIDLRCRWAAEQGRTPAGDEDQASFVSDFTAWVERERDHRVFWLACVDGEVVGMVNLLVFARMPTVGRAAGGWGYLCNMFVDRASRDRGLGGHLARHVLDHADELGLERVVLNPSERSRSFYAALGFAPADNLLVRPRP